MFTLNRPIISCASPSPVDANSNDWSTQTQSVTTTQQIEQNSLLKTNADSRRKRKVLADPPTSSGDGDQESILDLLLCLSSQSVKRLELLGSVPAGGGNQIGGIGGMNNEVHVTQPQSLPTSPIISPRMPSPSQIPSSSASNSISPLPPGSSSGSSSGSFSVNQNISGANGVGARSDTYAGVNNLKLEAASARYQGLQSQNNTDDIYWQTTKSGIRERNSAMCNNELMADIHFVVSNNGGEAIKYPAHKYVLGIGSSVFYAMFFGDLAETVEEVIVPDAEPEAFLKMLKYLYGDEIDLDEECVLPTLHVAKKYIIPQLAKACVQFLEASLTARNACVLLCQARIFDEMELMQRCWEVIDAQGEIALNSEGFLEIDYQTLTTILSRETLNCKELHIFNAAIAWATSECERRDIKAEASNLRAALGDSLQLIRVPAMELKEFADGPAQTGIFSLAESHDIFLHFTATNKPKLDCLVTPRVGLKSRVCHRFQSSAYRSNQWRYRGRCDSIQFSVDRRIFIVGYGLYGSSNGGSTYAVHIELKKQGQVLTENDTEFFSDGSSSTFHVYFRQPVQVDADTYYTASAVLDGMDLSYFGQEGMTDVLVGNVTFQFQGSAESTNGTGVQGGQIPELIFYGPSDPPNFTTSKVTQADAMQM